MTDVSKSRNFTLYPLLFLAGCFAAGVVVQSTVLTNKYLVAAFVLIFCAAAFIFRHRRESTVLIALGFLALGSLCYELETASIRRDRIRTLIDNGLIVSGEPVEIEGLITGPTEPAVDGDVITLNVDGIVYRGERQSASGRVRLYLVVADQESAFEYYRLDLRYGSLIAVACELLRENQYQNPGVTARTELLDRQGIDAIASVKSPLLVEKLDEGNSFGPVSWLYDLRRSLINSFRSRFSVSTAGVLTASMLGDKYFLDKPTGDIFREGGTFHVLVISGLHITFIGGVLVLFVGIFTRKPALQFAIVAAALWTYVFAVGADTPVVRAALMFTILHFSHVLYRPGTLLNSLGACVLILLTIRPSDIFSPSFQLTIVSVGAIVGMAFPLIEKLRAIGAWMPTAATPFPPSAPRWLKRSCEMLYWRPAAWNIERSRQIWSARIFKTPYFPHIASKSIQRFAAYVVEGLLVSVIVQLWLLPFLIIYFHRFTPISVVMNLWVGAVLAIESFSALIAVGLAQISEFLAVPFFAVTEILNYGLVTIPGPLVRSPAASWRVANYSGAFYATYALYFLPLILLGSLLWRWNPFHLNEQRYEVPLLDARFRLAPTAAALTLSVITIAGIIVFHPFSEPRPDGRLHIDFLDVGQGDAAFVTFPDGSTMLVDGGGRMEFRTTKEEDDEILIRDVPGIGESVVSPVLWGRGYSHVDHIVATHADADHIQGLADVARNFSIGSALLGRMQPNDPDLVDLTRILESEQIPREYIYRGQRLRFGDVELEVLYPHADLSIHGTSDNNQSVVLRLLFGSRAFLLTGDIEREAEQDLLNGGGILKADVIKVPHHGSRTSSTDEFVNAVGARSAVISVGSRSRFGHPHNEVIERWRAAGAEVMTTGERGMISVSTDGRDLVVSRFK